MQRPGELWRRMIFLLRGRRFDAELEEELRFHIEMKTAAYRQGGIGEEAGYAAMRRIGNATIVKERSREMWGWGWLEAFLQDTRHAFRMLRRSPAFTLIAVSSLALGIGANTVVFSVLNALVLKALPIEGPGRVYFVNNSGGPAQSFPNYRDIRDRNSVFESLFAYRITVMSLDDGRDARRVWGYLVTGNYFETLGIKPAVGRFFTPVEAAAHLPGVESAAYSSSVPLSIDDSTATVYPENTTDFRPKNARQPIYYYVSPGYFHTAGTRLVSGPAFTPLENRNSPLVAIVNRTLARSLTGTLDAAGRRFRMGRDELYEIVGVVEDGKYESMTETPKGAVFFPILQQYSPTIVLMARSRRPEFEVAAEMREAIARLDPHLAVYGVGSLQQMLGLVYLPMHAAVMALGAFGVLALMLAITGIYGLATYTVSRRTREIGIRMAIGASPAQILRLVFGRTGALVALGAGAGLAAALGPARRALRVDPVQARRHE